MTWYDWCIVLILNGAGIALGLYLAHGTRGSSDWFLGRRSLPFWAVGLSMFATNVDNADLTGVTGNTYKEGLHIISVYALGSAVGGILAAFFIAPAISRGGCYTNSEYLEGRFTPAARIISALIQIQYRSSMLGLIIWSLFLMLTEFLDTPPLTAWILIVGAVLCSGLYTAWGGLRAVVGTDALQGLVMMLGAVVIYIVVSQQVGGWSGVQERLARMNESPQQTSTAAFLPPQDLPRISTYRGPHGTTSPWVVLIGWTIVGGGYWTVNHTQTMRLMGSRSLWDMKMAAIVGVAVSLPVMIISATLGLYGRVLFPEIEPDLLYPRMARTFLVPGLKGMVVAAMAAAVISTFDSMGSALSAVFTRDVYARLIVRRRSDRHYVWVSRIATLLVLALGFAYLPFIIKHKAMINAFTSLISVFATPLFVVYLAGVFTRAGRHSAVFGLAAGSCYGITAFCIREWASFGPSLDWLIGRWPAFLWSFLITSLAIALATWWWGAFHSDEETSIKETGWLARSRKELPAPREHPFSSRLPWLLHPTLWAVALIAACVAVIVVFW